MKKAISMILTAAMFFTSASSTVIRAGELKAGGIEQKFCFSDSTPGYDVLASLDAGSITIEYSDGTLVDEYLHDEIVQKLINRNISEIVDIMLKHGLSLETQERVPSLARSDEWTTTITRVDSHLLNDLNGGGWKIEGITTMQGVFTFSNGKVYASGSPRITQSFFVGTGWDITASNISTGYTGVANNTAVNMWGGYDLRASFIHNHLPLAHANFGRVNVSHRIA